LLGGVGQNRWMWGNLKAPSHSTQTLEDLIDLDNTSLPWNSEAETKRILGMMSSFNLRKIQAATKSGRRWVGTIYRRTRQGQQRAEVRFDGISGCLRTPGGGSSRQTIIVVTQSSISTRLLSASEDSSL